MQKKCESAESQIESSETDAVQLVHPDERVDRVHLGVRRPQVLGDDLLQREAGEDDCKHGEAGNDPRRVGRVQRKRKLVDELKQRSATSSRLIVEKGYIFKHFRHLYYVLRNVNRNSNYV